MLALKSQYYRERTVPRKCLDPAIFQPVMCAAILDHALLKHSAEQTYCDITGAGIWERPAGRIKIMEK